MDDTTVAQQKATIGWWVTWTWIFTGLFSYTTSPGHSLFSLSALVFIFGGMFLAAGILGLMYWLVVQAIAGILTRIAARRIQKGQSIPSVGALPLLFMVMEIGGTAFVARVAFRVLA